MFKYKKQMTKSKLNLRNVAAIAACLAVASMVFVGCKEKEDPNITVTNEQSLTQEVYADNISGTSLTSFTTTGAWTSSIAETSSNAKSVYPKAGSPSWISIDPSSGDKAGTYNVAIILEPNTTGEDRSAVITISCKGEEIKITVTQKGVKEDGKPLTNNKDLLCAHPWILKSIVVDFDDPEAEDKVENLNAMFTFKTDGTLLSSEFEFNAYTISDNQLELCEKYNDENWCDYFTISKLTDSEFVLTYISTRRTETWKFVKP
jgi:hypothetical protein